MRFLVLRTSSTAPHSFGELLTAREAAALLNVHPNKVAASCQLGSRFIGNHETLLGIINTDAARHRASKRAAFWSDFRKGLSKCFWPLVIFATGILLGKLLHS